MRTLLSTFLIVCISHLVTAEDFSVFEKDGRFGIKNGSGEIMVPAVYEELGWTNGSKEIFAGVIGYKRDNLWGLVSIKNKILSENKFYTINPFAGDLILASIKGRFSNHLFYGILDSKGLVKISFNYFSLERIGEYFLATEFDQYHTKVGVLSQDNRVVIPIKYKSMRLENEWFVGDRFDYKKDLYLGEKLISQSLDSARNSKGRTCFKNGLVGYFDQNGIQKFQFEFKDVIEKGDELRILEFPLWEVYKAGSKILERKCDSLSLSDGFWTMHLNGVKHKVFPSDEFTVSNEYEIQGVAGDKLVVKNIKTDQWSVLNESGSPILDGKDSIKVSGSHFIIKHDGKWNLFNSYGSKINRFPMQEVRGGVEGYFLAKRNDYWGVIDFSGKTYINFKYDSISLNGTAGYTAKFHGRWGILDKHGNWKVHPEYQEFKSYGNLLVGRKGASYSYFHMDQFLFASTFKIVSQLGNRYVIQNEEDQYGVIDLQGRIIINPEFTSLKRVGDYFVLYNSEFATLADQEGRRLIASELGYQDFEGLGESFISAKRNGRWGFLDFEGRLRISNRYENVKSFREGFAAIKLRGRWGFIDKGENLVIQPHYEEVSSFSDGLAVVKENGKFGLIDESGDEIVEVTWPNIERTVTGNYLIRSESGLVGLVNEQGTFVLSPNFEKIVDSSENIIVKENGKMGLLDYDGNQKFKISYSEIKWEDEFLLFRR